MAGATLEAIKTGHVSYVTVAAIGGYPYLLTDGSIARVKAAWAGTDYAANDPLDGLFVELQRQQAVNPYKSFAGAGGGNATLSIVADAADRIGIDVARSNAGAETTLTQTLNRTDTTAHVKSTSGFPAAGVIYIGNECIGYTSVTATTFEGLTRGKYTPFHTDGGAGFADDHRSGFVDYGTNLEPIVSQYRRSWDGAYVGIWLHRIVNPLTGLLDTKAEARCIYAGIIDQPEDDPDHNATIIKCIPVISRVHDALLFQDQFKGTVDKGVYIDSGFSLQFTELGGGSTSFSVVASGAVGSTQMNAGYWKVDNLTSMINQWLADARLAGDITGEYTLYSPFLANSTITRLKWKNTFGVSGDSGFAFTMPRLFAIVFGWIDPNSQVIGPWTLSRIAPTNATYLEDSDFPPLQVFVASSTQAQPRVALYATAGVAVNQAELIPPLFGGPLTSSPTHPTFCMLQLGDGTILVGEIKVNAPANSTFAATEIEFPASIPLNDLSKLRLAYDITQATKPIEVKQIICLSGLAQDVLEALFYSTGTALFNGPADTLGFGLGIGIPGELLGQPFRDALSASPSGNVPLTIWITKTSKLVDLIDADLVLLGLYLVWKDAGLRFAQFATPVASAAIAALGEGNKAEPLNARASHRPPTVLTSEWVKPVIIIESGYDFIEDKYTLPPYVIQDRTAIDDRGGDMSSATIHARNIDPLDLPPVLDRFKARLGFFTQPFHKLLRSVSIENFETLVPLDMVTLTDESARDPATGRRRVIARAALILSHMSDYGGKSLGDKPGDKPRDLVGEVLLWLSPTPRGAAYSPCAEVDNTANTGGFVEGYSAGTKTLRTKAHEHTLSSLTRRDAEYFTGLDKVYVLEVDPQDPTAAEIHADTIVSVNTTDIVLTTGFTPTAGRLYRVVTQPFTTAQASQQPNCYFADDADGMIQNAAPPYRYELPQYLPFTTEDTTARAELVPTNAYGDGVGLDTGHQRALIRTINQLIDTKTAHQSPSLGKKVSNVVGGWLLSHLRLVFVGLQVPTAIRRYLEVAPHFRSTTGAPAQLRVTLSTMRPVDTTKNNVVRPGSYAEATFTTSSSTFVTPAHAELDLGVIGLGGWAWLYIELGVDCESYGLAKVHETVRR